MLVISTSAGRSSKCDASHPTSLRHPFLSPAIRSRLLSTLLPAPCKGGGERVRNLGWTSQVLLRYQQGASGNPTMPNLRPLFRAPK